jgi:uncharacterized protein YycO
MKADLLACYDDTWMDKVIRFFCRSKITHTAMMIDNDTIIDTDRTGVIISNISSRKGKYITLRCDKLTEEQREIIVSHALSNVGKAYDFFQLLNILIYRTFGIRLCKDDPGRYICVEVFVEAYEKAGIILVPNMPIDMVEPADLINSPCLREIKSSPEEL